MDAEDMKRYGHEEEESKQSSETSSQLYTDSSVSSSDDNEPIQVQTQQVQTVTTKLLGASSMKLEPSCQRL